MIEISFERKLFFYLFLFHIISDNTTIPAMIPDIMMLYNTVEGKLNNGEFKCEDVELVGGVDFVGGAGDEELMGVNVIFVVLLTPLTDTDPDNGETE